MNSPTNAVGSVSKKCESCGTENKTTKKRTVGNIFGGSFMWVESCRKCNWFLFDNEEHRKTVLNSWKHS